MQETDFISQNKDKWKEFEDILLSPDKDPERVTELFIETTDDLSYSRTYYANRSVRVYLNGIAQQVYRTLYNNRKRDKNAFATFWRQELPKTMWYNRKALYFSFVLFIAGVAIGLISSIYYPEFARIILGDQYVEMTEANIREGNPMAVYDSTEPVGMFLIISLNNIFVSLCMFVAGLLFGVGTVYYLLYNAIMVGAFIYFFIERGLFRESFLAIMLHGTLELSLIVLAGAAGFALAKGLMFPGTYSRGNALVQSAIHGIKIMIGVAVLLFYAAFIESFLTRHTDMGDGLRVTIILLSAILIVGYFVVYPWYRHRKGFLGVDPAHEIPKRRPVEFMLNAIKSSGRLFTESFDLFSKNARIQILVALVGAAIITFTYVLIAGSHVNTLIPVDNWGYLGETVFVVFRWILDILYPWEAWDMHLDFDRFPVIYGVLAILFASYSLVCFYLANKLMKAPIKINLVDAINGVFISALAATPLFLPQPVTFFILPLTLPFFLFWFYVSFVEKKFFMLALGRTFSLLKGNFGRLLGVYLSTFAMQWICLFLIEARVLDFIIELVISNIPSSASIADKAYAICYTFLIFFIPACVLSLSMYGVALFYYSAREINEASALIASIHQVGFKKRAYGMEQEA